MIMFVCEFLVGSIWMSLFTYFLVGNNQRKGFFRRINK